MTPEERAKQLVEGWYRQVVGLPATLMMARLGIMAIRVIHEAEQAAIQEERAACADLAEQIVNSQGWETGEKAWALRDLNAANYVAELIAGEIRKRK